MRGLRHRRANVVALTTSRALNAVSLRANAGHTVDCSVSSSNWLFAWTAMVNSISCAFSCAILNARRGVHAHDVAQVRHV